MACGLSVTLRVPQARHRRSRVRATTADLADHLSHKWILRFSEVLCLLCGMQMWRS